MKCIDQIAIHLLAQSLQRKEAITISGSGWSMFPVIFPGDSIRIQTCSPPDLRVGDIVLINRQNYLILHRIYRILNESSKEELFLKTKGDRNFRSDGQTKTKDVIGKVMSCGISVPRKVLWRSSNSIMKWINQLFLT